MLVVALALLLLNLTRCITWAALPSFLANLDEDSTYHKCDSAMCWWTTFDIELETDFSVPNSSLVIADYNWDWWEVKMSSLLEECAPSLPLSQTAYSFSACNNIEDDSVKEACIAVQRDWLDEKGAIKTTLIQMYSEMPKAESFINECLALSGDGVNEVEEIFDYYNYSDYYDYDDYDDYYYYNDGNDLVDEKSGGRQKRSLEGELSARVKQREGRRERSRKGQRKRKVAADKQSNGKSQRQKGGQKRKTTREGKSPKSPKTKRDKKKKKQKSRSRKGKKKTKKGKKDTKKGKKKTRKENKKTKSRKQASKKKEKKEAKRALKKIGLKKAPSQLVQAQLKCIWLAVDLALEDCGKKVLKNSNIGNS